MAYQNVQCCFAVLLFSLVPGAILMVAPLVPSNLSVIYQHFVATVCLSERISRTLISIAAFAAEFAPRTGVTATSTPVTCVLLFLFLCSAYTTEMMRSCGRRLSPKATDSCQLSLKNRAQVGEATTYESKRVAVPISTIAISSSSVVHLLRIFAGSSRKRGLMGLLVLARSVGAATEASQQKAIECIATSNALASNCPNANEQSLTEGDSIMIPLTVFFGIFVITAAIWGASYFTKKTRNRRHADPEQQTANGSSSPSHHSDRATVGDDESRGWEAPLSRFESSCQRLADVVANLSHIFHQGAAPTAPGSEHPWPLILETVSAWMPEKYELGELTPDGENPMDHLAAIDVPVPDPRANGQVHIDEINNLVALQTRRESHLMLLDLERGPMASVHHDDGQDEDFNRQDDIVGETQAGPSRSGYVGASMATITACKMD